MYYETAFASVNTAALIEQFNYRGADEACIGPLRNVYEVCTGTIDLRKNGKFPIRKGVGQRISA